MKKSSKFFAVLATLTILVSCVFSTFGVAFAGTAGDPGSTPTVTPPTTFVDFSTDAYQQQIDNGKMTVAVAGNTVGTYDAAEGAYKLTPKKTDRDAYSLDITLAADGGLRSSVAENPVFAMLVKNDSTANMYRVGGYGYSAEAKAAGLSSTGTLGLLSNVSQSADGNTYGNYSRSASYQLIVWDSKQAFLTAAGTPVTDTVWTRFFMNLALPPAQYSESSGSVYVKWVGAFPTKADAYRQAGLNMPVTGTFVDFSTNAYEHAADRYAVTAQNNTAIAYDGDADALKVTPGQETAAGNAYQFNIDFTESGGMRGNIADYPVLALLVKNGSTAAQYRVGGKGKSDAAQALGLPTGGSNAGTGILGEYSNVSESADGNTYGSYAAGTDYQLILWDSKQALLTDEGSTVTDTKWISWNVALSAPSAAHSASDGSIHVRWAGVFENVEAAAYHAETTLVEMSKPPVVYQTVVNFSTADFKQEIADGKYTVQAANNTVMNYDAIEGAYKVSPKTSTPDRDAYQFNIALADDGGLRSKISDYPVFAVYVKNVSTATQYRIGGYGYSVVAQTSGNGVLGMRSNVSQSANHNTYGDFISGTDYQLIMWDSKQSLLTDNGPTITDTVWYSWNMALSLPPAQYSIFSGDMYVKWVGVFENADAAITYAANTGTGGSGGGGNTSDGDGTLDSNGKPVTFLDFSTAEGCEATTNYDKPTASGNTEVAYDASAQALKLSPKEAGKSGAYQFGVNLKEDSSACTKVTKYPVIAVWMKTDSLVATQYSLEGVAKGSIVGGSHRTTLRRYPTATGEGGYQLLVWDTDDGVSGNPFLNENVDSTWYAYRFYFASTAAAAAPESLDEACYVKWVAAFPTVESAYAYVGMTPPADNEANRPATMVDLSTKIPYGGSISANDSSRTMVQYDAAERAYMVRGTSDAPFKAAQATVTFTDTTQRYEENKIFAAWVKLKTPNTAAGHMYLGTSNDKHPSTYAAATGNTSYEYTTEYQLVVWDSSSVVSTALEPANPSVPVTWVGGIMCLLEAGVKPTDDHVFWVKWAGIFSSVEQAYSYVGQQPPEVQVNTSGVTPAEMIDFSRNFAGGVQAISSNTNLTYDVNEHAVKVAPKDGNQGAASQIKVNFAKTPLTDGNRVVAALVKVEDTFAMPGWFLGSSQNSVSAVEDHISYAINMRMDYSGSTDWQLVILDFTNSTARGLLNAEGRKANWLDAQLQLLDSATPPENEMAVWIKWVGIFSSAEDVYKYSGMSKPEPNANNKPDPSPFFYNYGKRKHTGIKAYSANTGLEYDKKERALRVFPVDPDKAGCADIQVTPPNYTIPIKDYQVFAMLVKLPSADLRFGDNIAGSNNGKYTSSFLTHIPYRGYARTTEYQVVLFDGTDYDSVNPAYTGTWIGMIVNMLFPGTKLEAGESIYIKWAGAFPSVDAVYEYAGVENTNTAVAPNKDGPNAFFYDLTDKQVIKDHVGEVGDTDAIYDMEEECMSVTAIDVDFDGSVITSPGMITLGSKVPLKADLDTEKYKYIAVRVKLGNHNSTGSWVQFCTDFTMTETTAGNLDTRDVKATILNYTPSYEWQTIVIDCTDTIASYFFQGKWKSMSLAFFDPYNTMEDDVVYVKWAGVFTSIDEIKQYMMKTENTDVLTPAVYVEPEEPDEEGDEYDDEYYEDEEYDDEEYYEDEEYYDDEEYYEDEEYDDEEYYEDEEYYDDEDEDEDDDDGNKKKPTKKTTKKTKPVSGNKDKAAFPLLYVGIGIAVLAIASLTVFLLLRKKNSGTDEG